MLDNSDWLGLKSQLLIGDPLLCLLVLRYLIRWVEYGNVCQRLELFSRNVCTITNYCSYHASFNLDFTIVDSYWLQVPNWTFAYSPPFPLPFRVCKSLIIGWWWCVGVLGGVVVFHQNLRIWCSCLLIQDFDNLFCLMTSVVQHSLFTQLIG